MEKVVDSNYLRSTKLEMYFSASPRNKVILTSDLQNEASKTGDVQAIIELTKILTNYPNQVISLKSTYRICGLSGRGKGLRRRMIHKHSLEGFKLFSHVMNTGLVNTPEFNRVLLSDAQKRKASHSYSENFAKELMQKFMNTEAFFNATEVRKIRKNEPLNEQLIEKFYTLVCSLAGESLRNHKLVHKVPKPTEWPNLFLFRSAVFHTLYFLDWIEKGSPANVNLAKIVNDAIDLNFCTYATYFDGILPDDRRCTKMYVTGNSVIKKIKESV